jgi:hypothetical protein
VQNKYQLHEMEYNTSGEWLRLREYGRSVQQMANLILAEPDREKRTRMARQTVRTMSIIVPEAREMENYEQKLWEQLQQLCQYQLDVDAPYPLPTAPPTNAATDPGKKVGYYPHRARYRQYGKNIEMMMQQAQAMEESEAKQVYIEQIANYMKHSMQVHAGTQPTDKVVMDHLRELSKGSLVLEPEKIQLRNGLLPNRLNISNSSNMSHVKKARKKSTKSRSTGSSAGGSMSLGNRKKRKRPMR